MATRFTIPWREDEDQVLREWAKSKWLASYEDLARRLTGRSVNAIASRSNHLGIGRPRGYRNLSPGHDWDTPTPRVSVTPRVKPTVAPSILDHWDRATRRLIKRGWIHGQTSA